MAIQILEVISVNRTTESSTGDGITFVQFGVPFTVDEELKKSMTPAASSKHPKKLYNVVLQMYFKFEDAPYRVGSKWTLDIASNGKIVLTENK
jgi:hypothetical protein